MAIVNTRPGSQKSSYATDSKFLNTTLKAEERVQRGLYVGITLCPVSQKIFFHGGTPEIIVHIVRNLCL